MTSDAWRIVTKSHFGGKKSWIGFVLLRDKKHQLHKRNKKKIRNKQVRSRFLFPVIKLKFFSPKFPFLFVSKSIFLVSVFILKHGTVIYYQWIKEHHLSIHRYVLCMYILNMKLDIWFIDRQTWLTLILMWLLGSINWSIANMF